MSLNILILDDETRITDELSEYLLRRKFVVSTANDIIEAYRILKNDGIDILILDIKLKKTNGLQVLKEVKALYPSIEVIMMTAHGDMDTVIESMRLGAIDFLNKPFKHADVQVAIERTGKFVSMQKKLNRAEERNSLISMELEKNIERNLIGKSDAIKKVLEMTLNVAKYDVNVLITGESGTGKEIIARIIHFASARKDSNFFPVNCSAIPDTLIESEFFGHKKGSFTGALHDKKGLFELTDRGTLFLDEIADMPLQLQAKLLRVIEEKRIRRIGEDKEFSVDVRILAATNHDLKKLVSMEKFRIDLYHRLNTFEIHIPPLRERVEDIEPLLQHFVEEFTKRTNTSIPEIDPRLIKDLQNYDFPGNVRELKNLTERALILCKGIVLDGSCFPYFEKKYQTHYDERDYDLEHNETELIIAALRKTEYNQTKAAELLGISRHTLIRRINKFNIKI